MKKVLLAIVLLASCMAVAGGMKPAPAWGPTPTCSPWANPPCK